MGVWGGALQFLLGLSLVESLGASRKPHKMWRAGDSEILNHYRKARSRSACFRLFDGFCGELGPFRPLVRQSSREKERYSRFHESNKYRQIGTPDIQVKEQLELQLSKKIKTIDDQASMVSQLVAGLNKLRLKRQTAD